MPARACLLLIAMGPLLAAGGEERAAGPITVSTATLSLHIDPATGQLAAIDHVPSGRRLVGTRGRLSSVDLTADGRRVGADGWRCLGHQAEAMPWGKRLTVRSRAGDWEAATRYELRERGSLVARSTVFRYLGSGKPTVRGARFALSGTACGEAAQSSYEVLSRWPPERMAMSRLVPGRRVRGAGSHTTSSFVALHDRERKLSVIACFYSESEWADLVVREEHGAINVTHTQRILDRPTQGRAVATGTQHIRVVEGDWERTLDACREVYDLIGVAVPPDVAERGARSVVYSCHPGGTIDSGFRDVGHIRHLERCLPALHSLGVNLLWLLPFYEGHVYAPIHYDRFNEAWADEASLRQFTRTAHGLGQRVLLDLIPHGPRDESGLHLRHRDWVSTTEDGTMLTWWGCLSCDYAHPGWQRFMADHAADWVRRCDVDGYRVDCAGGGPPNWAPAGGRRPSQSGLWGALGILRQARQAMEQVKHPVVLLAETEGAPFNAVSEFTYPWTWTFRVLPALHELPPRRWVPKALRWLQNQKHCLPRGANFIWFVENHDTRRAEMVWGPGAHRALLAFCAFARGAPFLYQEQQVGYEPMLRKLYRIRASHDLFTIGEAEYLPLAEDPRVLTILRRHEGQIAVVAVNLSGSLAATRLRIPQRFLPKREGLVFHDLMGGQSPVVPLDGAVALPPWACAVLLVEKGSAALPDPPPQAMLARSKTPTTVVADPQAVTLRNDRVELVLDPARNGIIHALRLMGGKRSWVAGHDIAEGPAKLWIGRPAFRLSQARPLAAPEPKNAARFECRLGETLRASLAYSLREDASVDAVLRLIPEADTPMTRADLATTLRFPLADRWAVHTLEGTLDGEHHLWRPDDAPYRSRYWHATTDRYWESRLQPLPPGPPLEHPVYLVSRRRGQWLGVAAQASRARGGLAPNLVLKEREGDHPSLALRIEWLRSDRPVALRKGEEIRLTIRLTFGIDEPPAAPRPADAAPTIRAAMGNYEIANAHYRILLGRSSGGNIRRLILKGRDVPVVDQSRIYTDYGLYGDWTDPLGRKHPLHASNEGDVEPDVRLAAGEGSLTVAFTSFFRHPGYGHRSLLAPRMQYRLAYTFDASPVIRVEAGVRPAMSVADAKAFLAHTLTFPVARRWAVKAADGGFRGELGAMNGRVWEASKQPLDDPGFAFETPGGTAVIADVSPRGALQNFFAHAGASHTTAFLAWLDGRPDRVDSRWRTVRYALRLSPGGLADAMGELEELKPWPQPTAR